MKPWLFVAVALAGSTAAERDAAPLGRYLTLDEIHAGLIAAQPRFAECYANASVRGRLEVGEVFVTFAIDGDGLVRESSIQESRSGAPDLDSCLLERLSELRYRPHDEVPVVVGYPFVFREGQLLGYPMVFVKEREPGLMFFYVPSDDEDASTWVLSLAQPG